MAARCLDRERTRSPARAGPEAVADSPGGPVLEREEARAAAPEIERYLGNAYLQALAERASGTPAPAAAGPGRDRDRASNGTRAPLAAPLQTKLAVGAAGDAFEREADRVADALMRRAAARASAPAPGAERSQEAETPVRVARQTPCDVDNGMDVAPEVAALVERMRQGGFPLPARERALFEPLLGTDLGDIRIHTGIAAIQTARALNARAYAVGSDIAFGSGQYRPGTDAGRRLLAHELVHTVQQRSGGLIRRDVERKTTPTGDDVTPEQETAEAEQKLAYYIPPAAPIKQHVKAVAGIHDYEWLDYLEQTGTAPPGQPGYLVITPSGNAYAFVGDDPDTDHPKTFRAHPGTTGTTFPPFGYYINVPEKRWSTRKQRDVVLIHSMRYTTHKKFMPYKFHDIVSKGGTTFSVVKQFFWVSSWFEPKDWTVLEKFFSGDVTRIYLIVVPDPPEDTGDRPEQERSAPPKWVKDQQKSIKKQLKEAGSKTKDRETPDRTEVWQKETTGQWWMILTVNFDAEGKERSSVPIHLREGEQPEQLMARVKAATQRAYVKHVGQAAEKLTDQAPKWARDLRNGLWRELQSLRKQEPGKEDFPDQLTLDVGRHGEATLQESGALPPTPAAAPGSEAKEEVYLQVWVHTRTGDERLERVGGTAPWALQPGMKPDDLVAPVRKMAALLRTKERKLTDPGGREGGTATREAFRGEITPLDLPANDVTVTRARNKFKMDVKYDERYQQPVDLLLANMRTVFFKWEIYDVAEILKADAKLGERFKRMVKWPDRAKKLHEHLEANPRAVDALTPVSSPELDELVQAKRLQRLQRIGVATFGIAATPLGIAGGPLQEDLALYEQRAADPRFVLDDVPKIAFVKETRLRFPRAPGDYVVYCEATPEADEENDAIWASSRAFYPVQTKKPETLGAEVVEMGPNFAKSIDRQLQLIEARLSDPLLDEDARQALKREQRILTEQRRHVAAKETQDLPAATANEIRQATELLSKLEWLQGELPTAVERARMQGGRPIEFLPEGLQDVHYLLLREGKPVEDKIAEVKHNLAQLKGLRTRIGKFADTFKSDSPYRYRPEVAFVSHIDGHVYPLIMVLSEVSDVHSARKAKERASREGMQDFAPRIAYSLVDVTTEQTKKEYLGFSWKDRDDPAAHREAINRAFEDFGNEAVYGEGWLFVRIPPGPAGQRDDYHPGTDKKRSAFHPFTGIEQFESEEGILETAIRWLGYIAAAVSVAALIATGVGAVAAAALLGALAAVVGAGLALHSIRQRQRSRTLEWDAALALDLISIISFIPAAQGLRMVSQARNFARGAQALRAATPAWYQSFDRTQRLLRLYGRIEGAATVILLEQKLEDDIRRINAIPDLTDTQREELINHAFAGVAQSGLMMAGGMVASRVGGRRVESSYLSHADKAKLQRHAELVELEGMAHYPSLQERGYIDADGYWTAAGRQMIDGVVPGASKRLAPAGGEAAAQQPPVTARPAAEAARPAGAPETVAPQPSRASAREAAETRARPVSRAAGPGDVETAAGKGAPKRPRQKQDARAAEESGAGERAAEAEPEGGTFKGAPKKRPAKGEPSRQERRQVSGKKPTGPATGPPPSPLPAPEGVSLRSGKIWHYDRRDVVIVDTPNGPRGFYRRKGWGSLGEENRGGAQKDDWAPFEGFYFNQIVKPEDVGEGGLHRWSTEQNRQIAEWLKSLNLPKGEDVEGGWDVIQRSLEDAGAPVKFRLPGRGAARPPTPPPEPPRAPEPMLPTGPRSPPRPPAPPSGGGGGGPGAGGPPGVRPLTRAQAEYFARPEAILSSPRDYDHRVIVDPDIYRAAWRIAAGPEGGEPPPHGYLDQNRRAIVVYRPPRAEAPTGPTPPSGPGSPGRPGGGSPGGTGGAPAGPAPAQAARDLPARPPSPQRPPTAPSPDAPPRVRDPEDLGGRIERSEGADPDHYFAREYFKGDVITHGKVEIPEARYYVEAEFKDGVIEMDFVLRRGDLPGSEGVFRRSGQLRGREEFGRALAHFRAIHGEAAIKGIKGDWGGGDNLVEFNRVFRKRLRGDRDENDFQRALQEGSIGADEWNAALRSAARETHTGKWATAEEFSNIEIQRQSGFDPNTVAFDHIIVVFRKSGTSGSGIGGGSGPAPPTSGGSPGPAAPGRPSSAGAIDVNRAPEFARPSASGTGPGSPSRPPPAPQAPRGQPPSPPPPAGPGGGGGGRRGPGVRALTAREAAGIRPEVGLVLNDWAVSRITSRDLYQAAWRDATGGRGDPAPPHGFLDRDHRQIVVFEPPGNANVSVRAPVWRGPALAERPRPARPPGRRDGPGRAPTRPDPAQAARGLPAGPRLPPRPPAPPPRGGGGGPGGGGPPGVRPLTPAQAEYFTRPEAILSSPRDYDHRVIVDRDTYRAAWRATAGPQGGEPPAHGYLDQNRREIVVYRPPAEAPGGPRPPSRPGSPGRPGRARVGEEVNREREGNARRIEAEPSGRGREPGSRTAPVQLPHETDRPKVRGGLLDWLWRRRKLPRPQLGEQLSSGGDAGKLARSRPGEIGVFEAILPDGQTVAVKIYADEGGRGDANQRERFARDLAGAEAASRAYSGPRFHGEVNVGRRRLGYALERIEGDFAEAVPRTDRALTDSERIAERLAQARITDRTLRDVERFGKELLEQGYYYDGEVQGLIDFKGRYRPIDFEKVRPLSRDPRIRAEQMRTHQERISNEIKDLQSLRRAPIDRLPSDLPVPAAVRGLDARQRFGEDVIGWGGDLRGTAERLAAIGRDPQGERERLQANGLTLDMAKAWHVAYQHLDGQRHTAIFEAQKRLLAAIVKLMRR